MTRAVPFDRCYRSRSCRPAPQGRSQSEIKKPESLAQSARASSFDDLRKPRPAERNFNSSPDSLGSARAPSTNKSLSSEALYRLKQKLAKHEAEKAEFYKRFEKSPRPGDPDFDERKYKELMTEKYNLQQIETKLLLKKKRLESSCSPSPPSKSPARSKSFPKMSLFESEQNQKKSPSKLKAHPINGIQRWLLFEFS